MSTQDLFPVESLERAVYDAVIHHRQWMNGAAIIEYTDGAFDAVPIPYLTDISWELRDQLKCVLYELVNLEDWVGPDSGLEDPANLDVDTVLWLCDTLDPDGAIDRRARAVYRTWHLGADLDVRALQAIVAWLKMLPESGASYEVGDLAKMWTGEDDRKPWTKPELRPMTTERWKGVRASGTLALYFVASDAEGRFVYRVDRGGTRVQTVAGPFAEGQPGLSAAWAVAERHAGAEGDAQYTVWPSDIDRDAVRDAIGIMALPVICWKVTLPAPSPLEFHGQEGADDDKS